uniref:JAB1/MPN/MOV34 metalloenzyme domain-containing protein n=1 Tax=Arcella intermedia TaxID=1963864 RepID=A0A6B2LDM6_9EUKA
MFSILDQFVRRNEHQDRVIGTLLGNINDDGVVQINNCYVVPHMTNEKEQVLISIELHKTMLNLYSSVVPQVVVGWYTTSFHNNSVLLHEFYHKEMNRPPIHLLVDPSSLEKGSFNIGCYYSFSVLLGERGKLQEQFRPLRYVLKTGQGERTALEKMIANKSNPAPIPLSDLDSLENALKGLLDMLANVSSYVHEVATGKKIGDIRIGRLIEETLALLPTNEDGDNIKKIFDKSVQDILMVVYLANLTRTHLILAEQLRDNSQTAKGEDSKSLI